LQPGGPQHLLKLSRVIEEEDVIGMCGIQCCRNVCMAARPHHIREPRAEFGGVLQMFEHLLADQEIARRVIAVTDIKVLKLVAFAQTKAVEHPAGIVQRELADVETDAAGLRKVGKREF
jgi:hypothetical protein